MSSLNREEPVRITGAASSSVPDLVAKLFRDVSDLFRKEGELIRSEMSDKVSQLQVGLGKIAAGAIVLLVSLIVLADSLVIAVANIITNAGGVAENSSADVVIDNTGWGALIVGAIFAAVGAFLVRSGTTDLNVKNLTPDRALLQVQRDTELAKEQIR